MTFAISQEQDMLRSSVRAFLAEKMPIDRVRELMETEAGYDPVDWKAMADQGFAAMNIPEDYGGAGFSMLELGIVLEEMGRTLVPSPLFSSVVLAANAVLLAGGESHKTAYLPQIASGEMTATVAIVERSGGWSTERFVCEAVRSGDDFVLSGTKRYVIDGTSADVVFVAAQSSEDAAYFYAVPAEADGVSATPLETLDMTRKQAEVTFDDVRVPVAARLDRSVHEVMPRLYDLAAVALAFEQVGGAQRCMEMAVEYSKDRFQFGRPIGSFQAVKHMCADMLVAVESARSTAYYAGSVATSGDEDLEIAAPLAKTVCSDAFFDVVADTIQVHGGIGFTWEHDAHLYFKRAKSSQLMFGDPAAWRATLADRIGLEPAGG